MGDFCVIYLLYLEMCLCAVDINVEPSHSTDEKFIVNENIFLRRQELPHQFFSNENIYFI